MFKEIPPRPSTEWQTKVKAGDQLIVCTGNIGWSRYARHAVKQVDRTTKTLIICGSDRYKKGSSEPLLIEATAENLAVVEENKLRVRLFDSLREIGLKPLAKMSTAKLLRIRAALLSEDSDHE